MGSINFILMTNWWRHQLWCAITPNCYKLRCNFEIGKSFLWSCHLLNRSQTALIKRWEAQTAIKEKTTSLKKCPPCAIRVRPIKPPAIKPVKSQNWRRLLTPNMPKDMSENPTAACPLTNEQFDWQNWLGTKTGTKAVDPAKACTSQVREVQITKSSSG